VKIFAIADLHLSFAVDKPMDIFGSAWVEHPRKIRQAWLETVGRDDVVLIPGDISWAMRVHEAAPDFAFLGELPGTKVIIKGNHDYWWSSLSKLKQALPPSVIPLQNTSAVFGGIGIAGTRLWIDPSLQLEEASGDDGKIWERELERLKASLVSLPGRLEKRVVMTHFPPISLDGRESRAVETARQYGCDVWVFGHMHLGSLDYDGFNRTMNGIRFEFVSADYLDFRPKCVLET
jgi:predicted phosphohydrolase